MTAKAQPITSPFPAVGSVAPAKRPSDETGPKGLGSNVIFFGKQLSSDCRRCGAYMTTGFGHSYCAHVTCPLAIREVKRRKRKRTSTLEKEIMPKLGRA